MLYTIVVILVVLWFISLLTSYTMGGAVHTLLVIAIILILFNFIKKRRVG